jgi:hypothetical protein
MTYDPRIPTTAPTVRGLTTVIMGKKDDVPMTTLVPPVAGTAFSKPAPVVPTPAPVPIPAPAPAPEPVEAVVAPKKAAPKKVATKKPAVKKPAKKTAKKTATKRIKLSTDDIALRAYFISEHRHQHGLHGDAHSDWVEAERQLKKEARKKK